MISTLHSIHGGKTAAVIGSSVTAALFDPSCCDISIAVNGAAMFGHTYDYFMCGDPESHRQPWFEVDCSKVRIIARLVATMDRILYPKCAIRRSAHYDRQRLVCDIPEPASPHCIFNYKYWKSGRLQPSNNFLLAGGSISGCAAQLAFLMGCTTIKLFGCSFDHLGSPMPKIRTMNRILEDLRRYGVKIEVHGKTALDV